MVRATDPGRAATLHGGNQRPPPPCQRPSQATPTPDHRASSLAPSRSIRRAGCRTDARPSARRRATGRRVVAHSAPVLRSSPPRKMPFEASCGPSPTRAERLTGCGRLSTGVSSEPPPCSACGEVAAEVLTNVASALGLPFLALRDRARAFQDATPRRPRRRRGLRADACAVPSGPWPRAPGSGRRGRRGGTRGPRGARRHCAARANRPTRAVRPGERPRGPEGALLREPDGFGRARSRVGCADGSRTSRGAGVR